jgi:polysaccharide pyruvyl transferase CsaB
MDEKQNDFRKYRKIIVKNKKILVAGYYGFKNTGDEAILSSMLANLRAQKKNVDFIVVSGNPQETKEYHQVEVVHWQDIQQILTAIKDSDLVIIGGGGLFQDYWGAKINNLLTSEHAGISYYSGIGILAMLYNKPLMLYAVGVGPLLSSEGKELTRLIFSLAKTITVRDIETRNLLSSLGIANNKLIITNDPALTFQSDKTKAKRILKKAGIILEKENTVGVSIRNWDFGVAQEEWSKNVAGALDLFVEKYQAQILFIPFQINEEELGDDYLIAQRIIEKMEHKNSTTSLSKVYSAEIMAGLVACTDLMIGMRLHSLIFAAKEAIPMVGLPYDAKVDSFLRSINLYDYSVSIQETQKDELFEIVEKAWEQKNEIKKHLVEVFNNNEKTMRKNTQLALELLEEDKKEQGLYPREPVRDIVLSQTSIIAKRNQDIAEKDTRIRNLEEELYNITTSKVWAMTKLLQKILIFLMPINSKRRKFVKKILKSTVRFANYIHEKLPLKLQRKSAPLVGKFLAVVSLPKKLGKPGDITWEEFQQQVLAHRYDYRGIFIQKAVIDWGVPLYQRPQHISMALGKLGYLVIYQTDNSTDDDVDGFRYIGNNIWLTNSKQVNTLEETVHSVYSTAYGTGYLLMKAFNNPDAWMNKKNIFIYEYIDHVDPKITASDSGVKTLLKLKDFVFSGTSDFVIASATELEKEAIEAVGKDKVVSIPNGVEVEHYRNFDHQSVQLPSKYINFRKKHKKIVGYFGALAPWLWYSEINKLAHTRSDLGFVFIGPDYLYGSTKLAKLENILYLGTVDYKILPAYADKFDICFIPFEPGEIAHTTSPLKLFEYFALEKPVVTTSFMNECIAFEEVFHGDTVETLSRAIDKAFSTKDNPTYKTQLAHLADQNSWIERAKNLEFLFEELKKK